MIEALNSDVIPLSQHEIGCLYAEVECSPQRIVNRIWCWVGGVFIVLRDAKGTFFQSSLIEHERIKEHGFYVQHIPVAIDRPFRLVVWRTEEAPDALLLVHGLHRIEVMPKLMHRLRRSP